MRRDAAAGDVFVLSAFDRDRWCPVLQARFQVGDVGALQAILGEEARDDPELSHGYVIAADELAAVTELFGVAFDPAGLRGRPAEVHLCRQPSVPAPPYLVHTGYELPLLIDGRKKLARMSHAYPPLSFEGEERFDAWVADGALHKEEVLRPFPDEPARRTGQRTVYYVPKGEEWRIAASKLLWGEFGSTGAWSEAHERIEGLLLGYEDWQNDWWIDNLTRLGVAPWLGRRSAAP